MTYAFINCEDIILRQKKNTALLAVRKKVSIDVWLEMTIENLYDFVKNLKQQDILIIESIEMFKNEFFKSGIGILKNCHEKEIPVVSVENQDKSAMYSICLLNKPSKINQNHDIRIH